jgi:flavorubredoxin
MRNVKLFESKNHLFVCLNENKSTPEQGIHSNQYFIKHDNQGILLDPGGFNIMSNVLIEILRYTSGIIKLALPSLRNSEAIEVIHS